MKMSKNYKKLCVALGLSVILGAGSVAAVSGTKNVQATYRDIKVTYNGVTQSMSVEPFLVNGSTYVPLRAVSDILGVSANWSPTTNTVSLTGGSSNSSNSSAAEIAQLNYQIATLTKQLSDANAELATYKANNSTTNNNNSSSSTTTGTNITTAQLEETEEYLNDTLSTSLASNIPMSYELSLSGNQLYVRISYSSKTANKNYANETSTSIEKFIKKVCENIVASHKDIAIEGVIEYSSESEEKATFTRSKTGKYEFTHSFDEDKLVDEIENLTDNEFYFDNFDAFDSLDISEVQVDVRTAKTTVNAKIYLESASKFADAWNALSKSQRNKAVEDQLDDIHNALAEIATDYDITVTLYHGSSKIATMDADGDVSTNTL